MTSMWHKFEGWEVEALFEGLFTLCVVLVVTDAAVTGVTCFCVHRAAMKVTFNLEAAMAKNALQCNSC